jgi:meso-butanediol dehydrogenase / (S,S)-butanediol dehydrogenase / diacetyl reductase
MRLKGKVALVTGAASGIGQAIASLFCREGARVAIADINDGAGRQTAAEIGEDVACYIRADVSCQAEVERLVEETVSRFGTIDILVNNAAIVLFKRLVDTEVEEWDKVIATNLRSVYLCSRYTLPHMIRRGGGVIVNISSARALATSPLVSSYDASKGAIVALTRSLALEYAPNGIRVNCVLPGAIDTPVFRANLRADGNEEAQYRATVEHIPLRRVGLPLDIARAVLFLASEESSYVTGAPFLIDGGLLAQA